MAVNTGEEQMEGDRERKYVCVRPAGHVGKRPVRTQTSGAKDGDSASSSGGGSCNMSSVQCK